MWETEKPAGPPDVAPLDLRDIDIHREAAYRSYEWFLRDHLHRLDADRSVRWQRDYSSIEAYQASVEPMRDRFKQMLGFWTNPADRIPPCIRDEHVLREDETYVATRLRLEVCPGLETYAVKLVPRRADVAPGLIIQHGYGGTPEEICGLTSRANHEDYSYRSLGLRAVRRGYHVMAVHHPYGYGTIDESVTTLPEHSIRHNAYGKNRLHRLAVLSDGSLLGLDMLATSRGIDLMLQTESVDPRRIGMYGLSQGGLAAMFLPAIDLRIKASISSAYFNARLAKLIGPHRATCYLDCHEEDKFLPQLIPCFGDPDIVSLIAPRAFAVEAGVQDTSVDFEKARIAFQQAKIHYDRLGIPQRVEFIGHEEGHICATGRAFAFLNIRLAD